MKYFRWNKKFRLPLYLAIDFFEKKKIGIDVPKEISFILQNFY